MRRVLPIVLAAGCGVHDQPTPDGQTTASGPTFAHDTYYSGIVPPYASPEACVAAADPNEIVTLYLCELELAFCAGGKAGMRQHDIITEGEYNLEGSLLVANIGGAAVTLDTRTGQATNAMVDDYILDTAGRWDTPQFDVITCPDGQ